MRGGAKARPGGIYHLISRFVAQEFFVESAVERRTYLSLLGMYIAETDWRCFSFAIMSNHIHLGLVAGCAPLRDWLRPLHSTFATWINGRHERIGAVFVRGPNMIAFRPDGVGHLVNYMHRNPVRAGVVAKPNDTDWTSHRAYSGASNCPKWLDLSFATQVARFESPRTFAASIDANEVGRHEPASLELEPRRKKGRPTWGDACVAGSPSAPVAEAIAGFLSPKQRNSPPQQASFSA